MGVVLLVNPKSGRGIGVRLADRFEHALRADGWGTTRLAAIHGIDAEAGEGFRPERFAGADALAVIGGDGTLSRIAALAAQTATPVYHVPVGNENLFARQFGMTRSAHAFAVAMRRRDVVATDLASLDLDGLATPFLIMASVGPDAGVVHRLAAGREKAIGHLAYTGPALAEFALPAIPRLTLEVDGRRVVNAVRGWAVVANARPYGVGVDFARHAHPLSGRLDVVFMPCANALQAAWWMARARIGWHLRDKRLVYRTGRRVRVIAEGGRSPWQVDGETVGERQGGLDATLVTRPGALPVLRP